MGFGDDMDLIGVVVLMLAEMVLLEFEGSNGRIYKGCWQVILVGQVSRIVATQRTAYQYYRIFVLGLDYLAELFDGVGGTELHLRDRDAVCHTDLLAVGDSLLCFFRLG